MLSPVSAPSAVWSETDWTTPGVGGDGRALLDREQVARHDLGRRHGGALAVAHDERRRGGHPLEAGERALGALLLHEPEGGVRDHDGEDRERLVGRVPAAFVPPHPERDPGRGKQQQDERALELGEEAPPAGDRRGGREFVTAVLQEAGPRLA